MSVASRVKLWVQRLRDAGDLAALGSTERENLARDLGIALPELDHLMDGNPNSDLRLHAMEKALGIEPRLLETTYRTVLKDLEMVCSSCGDTKACDRHLRAGDAARTFESFCPNALTLQALRQEAQIRVTAA